MITIEDNDLPIAAASKIVSGTKAYNPTQAMKAVVKAITGTETAADTIDMFDLEEIKEIADYLLTYYYSHKIN